MSNPDSPPPSQRRAPVPMDRCGMALAAQLLMERWSMLIVREAFYGVKRFDDIREDTGIPRSVLTARLKHLVAHGILARESYKEDGARVRSGYVLTDAGRELALTILALMQWGDTHLKDGERALSIQNRDTGKTLKVALVEDDTPTVSLSKVTYKVL